MLSRFGRYIEQGREAVATHPDRVAEGGDTIGEIDFQTAAIDTIASILHALDDEDGARPEAAREAAGAMDGPARGPMFGILEAAWRSYVGDFEDIER